MSFDWRSFATGFLEKTQETIEERREEAKTFEKEQRAAAERNAQTISRRRAIADQVTGYARYLQNNGVTEEQLQAVIASGPQAIATLTERVQAAVEANNGRPLGAADAATIIRMPEGFQPIDMTTDEFIRQTYGLSAPTVEQPEEELTFLQRVLGRGEMRSAEERLSRTPMVEGMTILDINRAAQRAEYESLIPGTFVSFASDRRYDVTEEGVDFLRDFTNQLGMTQESQDYRRLAHELGPEESQLAQRQMLIETVDPLVRGYAQRDPEGFMRAHEAQLRNQLGDAYVQQLREELGLDAPEPEEEAPAAPDAMTEAPALGVPAMPSMESIPVAPPASETDVDDEGQEAPEVEPSSETRVRINGEIVTYQQWLEMSRSERRAAGLPLSFIGGQNYFNRFGVGLGLNDPETGERLTSEASAAPSSQVRAETRGEAQEYGEFDRPEGSAGRRQREQQAATMRRLVEEGVDEMSIALLNSHGSDMVQYLEQQGAKNEEEILLALTEWGQKNNIVMPFDKSTLISAIMPVVNR